MPDNSPRTVKLTDAHATKDLILFKSNRSLPMAERLNLAAVADSNKLRGQRQMCMQLGRRLGLLVTTLLLTACIPTPIAEWISPPVDVAETIDLRVAVWSSGELANDTLQALINDYPDPNTVIELDIVTQYTRALGSLLQEERPPDIFLVDMFNLPNLVDAGDLAVLKSESSTISSTASTTLQLPALLLDDIYLELQQMFTIDGALYCVPREFTTLALVYNRQLFQAAGLAYPEWEPGDSIGEGWNWERLQSSAQTLTETTNPFFSTFGLAIDADFSRWMPFLAQAGGTVTAADQQMMTIDSADALQSLEFYLGLAVDGYAVKPASLSSRWGGEAFGIGRVGMVIEGSWVISYLEDEFPTVDFGIAPLPVGPAGRATVAFGNCYAINANSSNQTEALQLIEYLTNNESMERWQAVSTLLPARVSLEAQTRSGEPLTDVFYDGLSYAVPWQLPPGFGAVVDAVNGSMQQVLDAEVDAEEVLRVGRVIGTDILESRRK